MQNEIVKELNVLLREIGNDLRDGRTISYRALCNMQIHTAHHRHRAMPQLIGCIPDYGIIHSIISRECIVHRSIVENGKCN